MACQRGGEGKEGVIGDVSHLFSVPCACVLQAAASSVEKATVDALHQRGRLGSSSRAGQVVEGRSSTDDTSIYYSSFLRVTVRWDLQTTILFDGHSLGGSAGCVQRNQSEFGIVYAPEGRSFVVYELFWLIDFGG